MPKLAIVVWYQEYQNEPSKPDKGLVSLPDDPDERDKMLAELFVVGYGDEVLVSDVTVEDTDGKNGGEYGDLQVGNDSGIHMFVTYAELPDRSAELIRGTE